MGRIVNFRETGGNRVLGGFRLSIFGYKMSRALGSKFHCCPLGEYLVLFKKIPCFSGEIEAMEPQRTPWPWGFVAAAKASTPQRARCFALKAAKRTSWIWSWKREKVCTATARNQTLRLTARHSTDAPCRLMKWKAWKELFKSNKRLKSMSQQKRTHEKSFSRNESLKRVFCAGLQEYNNDVASPLSPQGSGYCFASKLGRRLVHSLGDPSAGSGSLCLRRLDPLARRPHLAGRAKTLAFGKIQAMLHFYIQQLASITGALHRQRRVQWDNLCIRAADTMAVNISGLRRNIKNVAHNYTDAQVRN